MLLPSSVVLAFIYRQLETIMVYPVARIVDDRRPGVPLPPLPPQPANPCTAGDLQVAYQYLGDLLNALGHHQCIATALHQIGALHQDCKSGEIKHTVHHFFLLRGNQRIAGVSQQCSEQCNEPGTRSSANSSSDCEYKDNGEK